MMNLVSRLLRRSTPTVAEVRPADAPAIAAVHAASFRRGWGEDEIQRLSLVPARLGRGRDPATLARTQYRRPAHHGWRQIGRLYPVTHCGGRGRQLLP